MARRYARLTDELKQEQTDRSPRSVAFHEKAKEYLVDGGSHAIRLPDPLPLRIVSAEGAWVRDEDDHDILDFWQGHLGNILGHNPDVISSVLARAFGDRFGLQTGFADRVQAEVAEIICRRTGSERVRFTTSGTLSTMYAIMLSRAFTRRDLVMKVGGGWHGAQPWALKGVAYSAEDGSGFQHAESEGLPHAVIEDVIVTAFNDPDRLREHFREHGDRIACFIVEPFIGAGGFIPATREYLQAARELTTQYGAVLIFDEVITGFRFRAGNVAAFYDIQPDLAVFGKAIGGGMPVAAVAGRADIMRLAGRETGCKVKFSGGTYSAHPASMLAAKTMMEYLVAHEDAVYPQLSGLGEQMRGTVEQAFVEEGIYACCTGGGNGVLPGSSFAFVHFPHEEGVRIDRPEDAFDPAISDVELGKEVLRLALLLENVYVLHGHGVVSTAHTEGDIELLGDACRKVARRVKPYR